MPRAVMIQRVRHIGQPHRRTRSRPSTRANTPAHDATRSGVLPDTTNVLTAGAGAHRPGTAPAPGACSTTTCAFVPLTPNDDTPARRGRPDRRPLQS